MFKLEFLQNSKLVLTFDLLIFRDLVRWFWLPFCATLFGMFGLGPANGPSRARESRHQWSQRTPEPQRNHRHRCTGRTSRVHGSRAPSGLSGIYMSD